MVVQSPQRAWQQPRLHHSVPSAWLRAALLSRDEAGEQLVGGPIATLAEPPLPHVAAQQQQ